MKTNLRLTPLTSSTALALPIIKEDPIKFSLIKNELIKDNLFIGYENLQDYTTNLINC